MTEPKTPQYRVKIHGVPDCSDEEKTRHFHDYWLQQTHDLFRRWEEQNPDHGMTPDEIHRKKELLFHQNHSSGFVEIMSFP